MEVDQQLGDRFTGHRPAVVGMDVVGHDPVVGRDRVYLELPGIHQDSLGHELPMDHLAGEDVQHLQKVVVDALERAVQPDAWPADGVRAPRRPRATGGTSSRSSTDTVPHPTASPTPTPTPATCRRNDPTATRPVPWPARPPTTRPDAPPAAAAPVSAASDFAADAASPATCRSPRRRLSPRPPAPARRSPHRSLRKDRFAPLLLADQGRPRSSAQRAYARRPPRRDPRRRRRQADSEGLTCLTSPWIQDI